MRILVLVNDAGESLKLRSFIVMTCTIVMVSK